MNKRCARCEKVVYPIEELKCLDKVWHKPCFKCQECGMTLSMKTYKGFNKLPYCEAHIPRAKATTVAETPEMKRLAENTKNQSNVQYHAEFEKNKAKFTQVADDPEIKRITQNSKVISNASYHGDSEKKAWMESKRSVPNDAHFNAPHRPEIKNHDPTLQNQSYYNQSNPNHSSDHGSRNSSTKQSQHNQAYYHQQQSQHYPTQNAPIYNQQTQEYYSKGASYQPASYQQNKPSANYHHQTAYPDSNHNSYSSRNAQNLIYSSQTGPVQQNTTRVGSIADYDPSDEPYSSSGAQQSRMKNQQQHYGHQVVPDNRSQQHYRNDGYRNELNQNHNNPLVQQQKVSAPPTHLGRCYRAIYDYEAAASDEVSFKDGDLITNCTSIDEGWMMGTVKHSGKMGMLPANYVEKVA